MYRGTSPIFDVPEFPPLRRVKPLPKRRRTSDPSPAIPDVSQYAQGMMSGDGPVDMSAFGLNMPLPQYYMPIFNGVQDLFRMGDDRNLEYPGGLAVPVGAADEEDHGDGDYIDHLQQPGNTKKRKVPAAHHSTTDPLSSPTMVGDDDQDERAGSMATPSITNGVDVSDVAPAALVVSAPVFSNRRNRSSAATLAGLQHKELLKTRKRQLAAVLGALSHGDTLALDQALSARYSNMASLSGQNKAEGKENEPDTKPRRRWLKRRELLPPPSSSGDTTVPKAEFTFTCPSPTSERLVSTREEVAVLHSRFEAELSRQAAKAAEVAKQNALTAENGTVARRADRTQRRSRTSGALIGPSSNHGLADTAGTSPKSRTSKKKKRSALANASNPHHLRNYVPSRIPHSGQGPPGQTQGTTNAQNLVSPPPIRFLAAEIAPRRRKKTAPTGAPPVVAPLSQPEDEWICAFCEYNLFYGEESAFRRVVRSRKKILGRRRRARERAAAAASGQKTAVTAVDKSTTAESFESQVEDEYAGDIDGSASVRHGVAMGKKERDKPV